MGRRSIAQIQRDDAALNAEVDYLLGRSLNDPQHPRPVRPSGIQLDVPAPTEEAADR